MELDVVYSDYCEVVGSGKGLADYMLFFAFFLRFFMLLFGFPFCTSNLFPKISIEFLASFPDFVPSTEQGVTEIPSCQFGIYICSFQNCSKLIWQNAKTTEERVKFINFVD